ARRARGQRMRGEHAQRLYHGIAGGADHGDTGTTGRALGRDGGSGGRDGGDSTGLGRHDGSIYTQLHDQPHTSARHHHTPATNFGTARRTEKPLVRPTGRESPAALYTQSHTPARLRSGGGGLDHDLDTTAHD